jgi:hypothetical protein
MPRYLTLHLTVTKLPFFILKLEAFIADIKHHINKINIKQLDRQTDRQTLAEMTFT